MPTGSGDRSQGLIGRDAELRRVTDQVSRALTPFRPDRSATTDPIGPSGAPLLVLGEAGSGKSALLDMVIERARSDGFSVLSVRGSAGPLTGSFAGLGRLLTPLADQVEAGGGRLAEVVRDALGWGSGATPASSVHDVDRTTLLPLGVLAALTTVAEERPVLVCVDDAQDLDTGSRDVLAAVVRRLTDSADEGIAWLFAQRGSSPLAALAGACDLVDLPPLSDAEAGRLLSRRAPSITGRTRLEIVRIAAGNPLALLELGRAVREGDLPVAAGEHLPVTDTIRSVFARDIARLPAATRKALLLVACGEHRLPVLESETLGVMAEAWEPAEVAGVVLPLAGAVRFRHPLLQSVVYDAATPAERRAAHTSLADALADDPGGSAWQRSAGLSGPDERTASALDAFATRLAAQGDAAAAATTLERAAGITSDTVARAGRLLGAAQLATGAGSTAWVLQLVDEAERLTHEPTLLVGAAQMRGWSAIMSDRPQAALDHLLAAAGRADEAGPTAHSSLATAASSAYILGTDAVLDRFSRTRETARCTTAAAPGSFVAWVLHTAVAAPGDELVRRLGAIAPPPQLIGDAEQFHLALAAGAASYFLDRSEQAVAHLVPVVETMRHGRVFQAALTAYGVLGWALIDTGRWQRASDVTQEALRANALPHHAVVDAVARVQDAIVTALRGEPDTETVTSRAEAAFDPADDPGLAAHLDLLRARVAVAADDAERAWSAYRALFDDAGRPRHRHVTGLAVAEVAAAALRVGRGDEARELVVPMLQRPGWRSARQSWVESRARALLTGDRGGAAAVLAAALAGNAGRPWPFDRALAHLELAERCRQERRAAEAREALVEAIETFTRLGARPFEDHARRQLRAAGVTIGAGRRNPIVDLPAQQVQILRLAATGLTNREIGARLFLSPRTVASHLYRTFPKLGVASRAHLPGVVERWDTDAAETSAHLRA